MNVLETSELFTFKLKVLREVMYDVRPSIPRIGIAYLILDACIT